MLGRRRRRTGRCRALYLRAVHAWIEGRRPRRTTTGRARPSTRRARATRDDARHHRLARLRRAARPDAGRPRRSCAADRFGEAVAHSPLARGADPAPARGAAGDGGRPRRGARLIRDADAVLTEVGDLRRDRSGARDRGAARGMPDAAEARLRAGYEQLDGHGREGAPRRHGGHARASPATTAGGSRRPTRCARSAGTRPPDEDLHAQIGGAARARGCSPPADVVERGRDARPRSRVRLAEDTDFLVARADALTDLGRPCSRRPGREEEADAVLAEASALYVRKGDVVSAARWRRDHQRTGAVPMAMKAFTTVHAPR